MIKMYMMIKQNRKEGFNMPFIRANPKGETKESKEFFEELEKEYSKIQSIGKKSIKIGKNTCLSDESKAYYVKKSK